MLYDITILKVYDAYLQCRHHKRYTISLIQFELQQYENVYSLWQDLQNGTYQIGKSTTFLVTRPKLREVFAANFRDRIVHHLIINRLEPLFELEFILDSYSCRKGKGTDFGVKRLKELAFDAWFDINLDFNNLWVYRGDFKGFFMTIDKTILWNKLYKFITERYTKNDIDMLLWLTELVVKNCPTKNCIDKANPRLRALIELGKSLFHTGDNFGLPIGNLTSLWFANFYLNDFDHYMKDKFTYYGRYVDDFYVITDNKKELLASLKPIRDRLQLDLHITLHPTKFYLQPLSHGCKFIGSVVKFHRTYVGNQTVSNFIDKIKDINEKADNNPKWAKENIENIINSMNSYLGFLKHKNAFNIKKKLVNLMSLSWMQYVEVCPGYDKLKCIDIYKLRNLKVDLLSL